MKDILPIGTPTLPFSELESQKFEILCTEILKRDPTFIDVHHILGKGRQQEGIDICAKYRDESFGLIAIECKCWKNYNSTELKETLNKFIKENEIKRNIKTYLLIFSQDSIPMNIEKKIRDYQDIFKKNYDIELETWTGIDLTRKCQSHPDLIKKYFPTAISDMFECKWMAKVNFIENLHKALLNQDPKIRDLGESLLDHSFVNPESLESKYIHGNHFTYKNKWVEISAILPTTNYFGSAAITITAHDTHGTIITLDNKWLLKNFLGNDGQPINSKYRPFYQGGVYQKEDQHIIDFKNCRFHLPLEAVEEISKAADILTHYYITAFENIEKLWSAKYFPFISKYKSEIQIGLCAIDTEMWEQIQEFIHAHDIDKGDSDWHIFYAHHAYLQVHSPRNTKELNTGFHGIFFAHNIDGINFSNEITLVWQKPYNHNDTISDKDWWSCEKAYTWITEKLIPKVIDWQIEKQLTGPLVKIIRNKSVTNKTKSYWDRYKPFRDIRKKALLDFNHFRELELIDVISRLQYFYISSESNRAYFDKKEISQLYRALISLIHHGRGYFPYLNSKLSFGSRDFNDINELTDYLNKKIELESFLMNNNEIELIFRAMLEAIRDTDDWLTHQQKEEIYSALQPFMSFYDYTNSIERYSEF